MNNHPQETKDQFLILRSEGRTYEQIAEELNVSKRTLIEWSKELNPQIENLRALRMEALQEKYYMQKEKRIELLGEHLETVSRLLTQRNYFTLPTGKLFDMMIRLTRELRNDVEPIVLKDVPDPASASGPAENQ